MARPFITSRLLGTVAAVTVLSAAPALAQGIAVTQDAQSPATAGQAADVPADNGTPSAPPESAGSSPGDIVVTAQRRSESVQRIPIAIQAVSGETLAQAGVVQINRIALITPSFVYSTTGPDVNISMRGISGEIGGIAGEPPVSLSQDGVPLLRQQYFYGAVFDVERIEVLRGPQGTISGRNSVSGTINIISRRPTRDFRGGADVSYGNYSAYNAGFWASGPVSKTLSAHVAVERRSANGFIKSTVNDVRYGGRDDVLARASLLFEPSENAEFLLSADYYNSDDRSPAYVSLGLYDPSNIATIIDPPGFGSVPYYDPDRRTASIAGHPNGDSYTQLAYGVTLQGTFELGPETTLRTISGYRKLDGDQTYETVRGPEAIEYGGNPYKQRQYTQEVSLTTSLGPDFDILAGAVYLNENASSPTAVTFVRGLAGPVFNPPAGVTLTTYDAINLRSYAGFGQIQWRFLPTLQLTLGGRYTSDRKSYRGSVGIPQGAPPNPAFDVGPLRAKFNSFTPRAALDWKPNSDITIYASVARGFTAGGFGAAGGLTVGFSSYAPETVTNYEAGIKTQWFDRKVTANLTGFWADYKDLQYTLLLSAQQVVTNAGKARVKGLEAELGFHPLDGLDININATLLDPKYRVFCANNPSIPRATVFGQPLSGAPSGICPDGNPGENLSGNQLPRAAKLAVTGDAGYKFAVGSAGDLSIGGNVKYQSRIFFDAFNAAAISQKRYALVDLRAAFDIADTGVTIAAFARNIFDTNYYLGKTAFNAALAALDRRVPGTAANPVAGLVPASTVIAVVGEPRTYGGSVSIKF